MSLTDRETLEMSALCNAAVDGTLTEAQKARLEQRLRESEAARQFYVRYVGLSASLHEYAGESQVEEADAPSSMRWVDFRARRWTIGLLAAAAGVVLGVGMSLLFPHRSVTPAPSSARVAPENFVARLTGQRDCQWIGGQGTPNPGAQLRRGQSLELAKGYAEITFDSGALIVLEGPALLDLNSAWDATLRSGTLKASVPPEAIGFRVSNSAVEVTDLGTEFSMVADVNGSAEVLVLKGVVEAASAETGDTQTIVLHEKEARRFAPSGVSEVNDRDAKFARFNQAVPLEHSAFANNHIHWSFDEPEGGTLKAEAFGEKLSGFDARLESASAASLASARTDGRWHGAIRFDGQTFAKASYPGLSGITPHTVSFWVKVPEESPLSGAYAMVAWTTTSKKLGGRPVHINWNRNPIEGPVGVLRTDFGGGFALGTTSLRDGRWHHVAVIFMPGDDDIPVQVKQYIDARLEGDASISGLRRGSPKVSNDAETSASDTLWLGRRLGDSRKAKDRFRGELDELFIFDRVLAPQEIAELMRDNQLPAAAMADAGADGANRSKTAKP